MRLVFLILGLSFILGSCQKATDPIEEVIGSYKVLETRQYQQLYTRDTITEQREYWLHITRQDYNRVALIQFADDITFFAKVSPKLIVPSRYSSIIIKREGSNLSFSYEYANGIEYKGWGQAFKQ